MKPKNIPLLPNKITRVALQVGLLAALCAMPLNSARADFSNFECRGMSVSGYTNLAGNTFSNNSSISVTRNNLSNTNGLINLAAAVLEYQGNVGYGKGVVRVNNGASGTLQAITSDSASWAAGFWSEQIYGDPAIAELIVDNYGTMNGQAQNSTGCAFGFHNHNLYGGANTINHSGATCSATAKGAATGIDSVCYYGPINFVNNGTATATSSGVDGADIWPLGVNLFTFDLTNRAPIYCENNGYISAAATGGQTNHVFGSRVWAQGGSMVLINRGTFKGTTWGGSLCQANGVYCGSNVGDDWVVNTGQMIGEGGPGWGLGVENDGDNNGSSPYIATINILNSGVISNGVTSGWTSEGIYGGMGIVLWVSPGPTYLTNTASGIIHGGNMGIWAGVYTGPITIYNSGVIYGGGSEAFHLGDGNDTVYLNGTGKVTGVMNGGPGNNSLIFNLAGTVQSVNGGGAWAGNNLSAYGLGTSGNIVVSGKTYAWQNFNVSGTVRTAPTINSAPTAGGITYGQTLASSSLSGGNASVAGSFSWTTPSTGPLAGTSSQSVTFTPSDAANYAPITTSANVTVARATVTINGVTANDKVYDGTTAATINFNNVTLSGLASWDTNFLTLSTNGYTANFSSASIGNNKTVTVSGMTLQNVFPGLTGNAATVATPSMAGSGPAGNYTLTQPTPSASILPDTTLFDAYVQDGGSANNNFGSATNLAVKNDGGSGTAYNRKTYLKFDVSNATNASRVVLTLTPCKVDGTASLNYEWVTNNAWTETGITWNNQPGSSGTVLTNIGGYTVGVPVTVDVTEAAKSQAAKDGYLSIMVRDPNASNTRIDFCSREHPTNSWRPTLQYIPPGSLVHRYSFSESGGTTTADSIGGPVWTGTLPSGGTLSGGQLTLSNASSQYASLPAGIVNGLTNFTIMAWVNLTSSANWSRLFDFGNDTTTYMFLTPQNGSGMRFAMTTNGYGNEQAITSSALSTGVWHLVVVTLNSGTGILYVDGVAVGTNSSMTLTPSSLGSTVNNYIGKSQFPDPYLNGSLDEFRIYNRALTAADVALMNAGGPSQTRFAGTVTLGNLSQTYDGTAKSATATTTPSGLTVNLTYNGSANAPTNAGSYTVIGAINDANYQGSATNTLVINDATPPQLSLTLAGTNLTVSWPETSTGFTLQSRTNLTLGDWLNVTSPAPQTVGSQWQVTLPPTNAGPMFYRLMK